MCVLCLMYAPTILSSPYQLSDIHSPTKTWHERAQECFGATKSTPLWSHPRCCENCRCVKHMYEKKKKKKKIKTLQTRWYIPFFFHTILSVQAHTPPTNQLPLTFSLPHSKPRPLSNQSSVPNIPACISTHARTHQGCWRPAPQRGWSRHCWWPTCSAQRTGPWTSWAGAPRWSRC